MFVIRTFVCYKNTKTVIDEECVTKRQKEICTVFEQTVSYWVDILIKDTRTTVVCGCSLPLQ